MLAALTACSGDGSGTDPVEVQVGEAFTWNSFSVEEGWEVSPIESTIGVGETLVSPQVTGQVTNDLDEERAPIFAMEFSLDGQPLAQVSCSAMKLKRGHLT